MSRRTRRLRGHLIIGLLGLAVVLAVLPLLLILGTLVVKGVTSLNWAFFTEIPKPVGEPGGGMANAIAGTAYIMLMASCIGVPLGVGAAFAPVNAAEQACPSRSSEVATSWSSSALSSTTRTCTARP